MFKENKGLIHDQHEINGKDYINEIIDLHLAENDEILMNENENNAQSCGQVFDDQGKDGFPIENKEHEEIQLFPAKIHNFQGKISVQDTQNQDQADEDEITWLISIDIVIYILYCPPCFFSTPPKRVPTQWLCRSAPLICYVASLCLHGWA
jgi:hypothetical protein